jgi:CheY-like chemotaxis protein
VVASRPGRGTTVRLRLPMAQVDRAGVPAAPLAGGQHLAPGTTLRALVVEDDPYSRDVLTTLLRETGCEVDAAVDGEAGLAACRARAADAPYDIVFTDIRMPRLDGLQMLHALRADERTRDLPLIAVSASSLEHERRYYVDNGFQDFIGKPYEFGAIHEMLALHAGARLVPAALDAATAPGPGRAQEVVDRLQRDAIAAAGVVRRSVVRAQLAALADGAASGSMTQVRDHLAALAAAPPCALPEGLLALLEGDLRQYDFTTLEGRVRDALAHAPAGDDDEDLALKGAMP